jgi:hypothetical protein
MEKGDLYLYRQICSYAGYSLPEEDRTGEQYNPDMLKKKKIVLVCTLL